MTEYHSVKVDSPPCPMCREPMRLIKLEPSFAGIPELRTFECDGCRLMTTLAHIEDKLHPHPQLRTRRDGHGASEPTLVPRK